MIESLIWGPESFLRADFFEEMRRKDDHKYFMTQALRLGAKGLGWVTPNPPVGAVVVKNGEVIGKAYHRKAGEKHAEIIALAAAGPKAKDSTLYVTLEPCNHSGRTPPCVKAIIDAGVKRVVVGTEDPNPKVPGKGVESLRKAGIEVEVGIMEKEAERLIEAFSKHVTTGMPFVISKTAASLDGKIATATGESKWISSIPSLREVHRLRNQVDGVVVGSGTVLLDDPRLTTRMISAPHRDPARIVIDSLLRIPRKAKVLNPFSKAPTIIFTSRYASIDKIKALEVEGARVVVIGGAGRHVDLKEVMTNLGEMGLQSIMIEGGPEVTAAALKAGLVDKIVLFLAPKLIGGFNAPGVLGGEGIEHLTDAVPIRDMTVRRVGPDFMIQAYIGEKNGEEECSPA